MPTKQGDGYVSRHGRWHPRSWWLGHHDTRDACGEFTPDANLAGPCSPAHNRGRSSWGTQRHLPARRSKPASEREQHREALRLAKHAQDRRAEDYARGGGTRERRAFFGDSREAPADRTERRVRIGDADRQLAAHNRSQRKAS